MCRLWPYNRITVTPRDHEKSLAHSWCTIVSGNQFLKLHFITQICKLLHKFFKGFTLFCLNRMMPSIKRSPCLKLFHVFQHDHPWSYQSRPPAGYPRKTTDKLVLRFAALGFRKVFAVWAKPGKTYRMPIAGFDRIHLPYVLTVMLCIRVISLVHPDSFRIMVDGYIHTVSGCHLYSGGRAPAAGKVVNDQFSVNHGITPGISSKLI